MDRVQTYVANQQVLDTELNGIQDSATGLTPADVGNAFAVMDSGSEVYAWAYTGSLTTGNLTDISTDTPRDWRDQMVRVTYAAVSSGDSMPGDTDDANFDYAAVVRVAYLGLGAEDAGSNNPTAGNPPVRAVGSSWVCQVITDLWLYAGRDDGKLYLYNNTGGTLDNPVLFIEAMTMNARTPP